MRAPVALVILSLSLPAHARNLIKDGGFETPPTPQGSFVEYGTGQSFGPWTVVGASGNVATVSSGFSQNGFVFGAKKGTAWLDLTGVSNTATGVAQTVKTVAGQAYELTFWVGNVYDPNGIFGTTSTVNVYAGSTLLLSAVNSKKGSSKQVWQEFSVEFTATASKTVLSFINGDPSNDTNNGLDVVTLVPAAQASMLNGLRR
jgi:hypothetical protein